MLAVWTAATLTANMAEKPVWKADDFFTKTFGGEMEQTAAVSFGSEE